MSAPAPGRPAFDTVIVPDFSGPRAAQFEARSLLFLASWLEHAGAAKAFPLHLACIATPPPTVRALAEQCGATISVHPPANLEPSGVANKLRAFDAPLQTDRLLLLDVDIVVLGDLASIAALGDCLSTAPAIAYRVPPEAWQRIFPGLGLEAPAEWWTACLLDELAHHPPGSHHIPGGACGCRPMPPYFNSGVLWLPARSELGRLWAADIRRIAALFSPEDPAWHVVGECDQAGLATAIIRLRHQGWSFRRLPEAWHTNQVHLFRLRARRPALGRLQRWQPLRRTHIYHAIQLFSGITSPLTPQRLLDGLETYQEALVTGWLESRNASGAAEEGEGPAAFLAPLAGIAWLCAEMRRLIHKRIAPLWASRTEKSQSTA